MRVLLFILILFTLVACQGGKSSVTPLSVEIYDRDGDLLGNAKFTEHPDGVKISLKLEGLSPGFHGLHIHEKGNCDFPTFKEAGNHLNPDNKLHGLLNIKGAHLGDLPNIEASDKGEVEEETIVSDATLFPEGKNSLTKNAGTAIIITEEPDDGMTQISGDSGERIACGEIK